MIYDLQIPVYGGVSDWPDGQCNALHCEERIATGYRPRNDVVVGQLLRLS